MTYMVTPQHENPCPGGHEIYNFGEPFLDHYCYIFSLSGLCPRLEKNIFLKNNTFSLYDLYDRAPAQEPPTPGVMKFTIW